MQWLEGEFLEYLKQWEDKVSETEYSPQVKKAMCLSPETLQGIKMTGIYMYM